MSGIVSTDAAQPDSAAARCDRPILFSAPMVRALLGGRKTMTRRVQTLDVSAARRIENTAAGPIACEYDRRWPVRTKFAAGDRLWVRETWAVGSIYDGVAPRDINPDGKPGWCGIRYAATDGRVGIKDRPSIHMPRWASRLTLVVAAVRVERLQDISEEDAIAEGIEKDHAVGMPSIWGWRDYLRGDDISKRHFADPRESFRTLWESINGHGAWEANPWVTVTSFSAHRQNIDQVDELFSQDIEA